MVPPASHRVSRARWYSGSTLHFVHFAYRTFTSFGVPFQAASAINAIRDECPQPRTEVRFGLFRVRSPLLTESLLMSFPRPTLDPAAALRFRVRGFHPLWLAFPKPFCYPLAHLCSPNPGSKLPVCPLSLSLAATKEIDVSFSSSGYLDVSVPRVAFSMTMDSS